MYTLLPPLESGAAGGSGGLYRFQIAMTEVMTIQLFDLQVCALVGN
jgi:hypothetical protein